MSMKKISSKADVGNNTKMTQGTCEDSYVSRYSSKVSKMTKMADRTVMPSSKTRKDPTMAQINSMTSSKR